MTLRIGASLIVVLALAAVAEGGCTGNDDNEPSGRIVVFGSPDATLLPASGGKVERLRIGHHEFWDAAFSADGRRVAFNPSPFSKPNGGITLMDLSDGRTTVIPNRPPENRFESYDVTWSPNGQSLAFVNGDRVFTIAIDGSDLRELGRGSFPTWAPDGEHIVFASAYTEAPNLTLL